MSEELFVHDDTISSNPVEQVPLAGEGYTPASPTIQQQLNNQGQDIAKLMAFMLDILKASQVVGKQLRPLEPDASRHHSYLLCNPASKPQGALAHYGARKSANELQNYRAH